MDVTTAPAPAATGAATATAASAAGGEDPAQQGFAALLAMLTTQAPPTTPSPPPASVTASPTALPLAGPVTAEHDDTADDASDEATPAPQPDPAAVLPVVPLLPVPSPATAAAADVAAPSADPADEAATTPTAAPATAVPAVATSAPAVSTTPTTSTASDGPTPVSRQLFDKIEKAATGGNGTHRITVRLDPGTLGEVRVHLTVRAGQVSVRLGAGAEARAALTSGAPELQRLLQSAKGGDAQVRVAVHDLPAADVRATGAPVLARTEAAAQPLHPHATVTDALAATALTTSASGGSGSSTGSSGSSGGSTGGSTSDTLPQPGAQGAGQPQSDLLDARAGGEWTGAGAGQPGDRGAHAGTRRATSARDGDQDRVSATPSAEHRTTGPHRGVDVHM